MMLEDELTLALTYGRVKQIEKVFEKIYNEYYRIVYYTIKQRVSRKEDIEDLTNSVFLSFYNGLSRKVVIKDIKSYLCKISSNKAIDFIRVNKPVEVPYDENQYSDDSLSLQDDFFDIVKKNLSEEEYDIFIKHGLYEETFKEIAKDKNSNINTIKSIYRRLIKKLKGVNL